MRILSIRGKDLASLQGEFEVRLDAGPLADAGVFAIVGRTGSGKSTLLDALCLALFNKTPRLASSGGAKVGHPDGDQLASFDVRGLLRKGTAEGYAEVDFEGVDGRTYTARWSVRRARRRVDKRLQEVQRELRLTATDELLANGKRDCDAAIPEKLGLDFDQFRRAVLLAQGDFARFLQAKPEERAALLELMTGTEIYARLSMAAHARKKTAEDAQAKLESDVGAFAPLSLDARTGLEARRDALQRDDADAQASADALAASLRWYADRQQLRALVAEADALARRASEDWEDAASLRAEHARVTAAQPGGARLRGVRAARDAESKAHSDRTAARAEAAETGAARDGARAAEATAKEEAEASGDALRRAQPDIEAARELDLRRARVREALDAATEQLADARGRVEETTNESSAHAAALQENEAALHAAVAKLDALREHARVLSDWPQHERALKTLAGTETELASSHRARRALDQRQLRLDEDRAHASEAERRAEETFRRREATLADARDGAAPGGSTPRRSARASTTSTATSASSSGPIARSYARAKSSTAFVARPRRSTQRSERSRRRSHAWKTSSRGWRAVSTTPSACTGSLAPRWASKISARAWRRASLARSAAPSSTRSPAATPPRRSSPRARRSCGRRATRTVRIRPSGRPRKARCSRGAERSKPTSRESRSTSSSWRTTVAPPRASGRGWEKIPSPSTRDWRAHVAGSSSPRRSAGAWTTSSTAPRERTPTP